MFIQFIHVNNSKIIVFFSCVSFKVMQDLQCVVASSQQS